MTTYVFRGVDGTRVERRFPMSSVPDEIVVDGQSFVRVPCWGGGTKLTGGGWAGKKYGTEAGDADRGVPPARPAEFGGHLNTAA